MCTPYAPIPVAPEESTREITSPRSQQSTCIIQQKQYLHCRNTMEHYMLTKVQKWGNSLTLRIPKTYALEAKLENDSDVDISMEEGPC